jgi:tetratricopeptide (TPR) repeat protein
MLAMPAYASLGLVPDPATGRQRVDRTAAREMIDLLALLEQKTRGNLSFEESNFLSPSPLRPASRLRGGDPSRPPSKRGSLRLLGTVWLSVTLAAAAAAAQEAVSPLPPPVTRGLYRANWFEFLNALLEDDASAATQSLTRLRRAAQAAGVRYLSDFSRTAVFEGRKAEAEKQPARAARAYDAAIALDGTSYDAVASKIGFLVRQRQFGDAAALAPEAVGALLRTREARFAFFSSLALWATIALAAAGLATVLILLAQSGPRLRHDLGERAALLFGPGSAAPFFLIVLGLPLAAGLGPVWLLLWWAVLVLPYASSRERVFVVAGMLATGLAPLLLASLGRENVIRRSPLYVAAVDLEEQREDGAAEDGLRQASAVFSEDPDVWFLLGMYAQRTGDTARAISSYDRAVTADPKDYRAYVNRGNVRFEEGDYAEASRDYAAAVERNPRAAEALYNLSVARGELYDFQGQADAMARARAISDSSVDDWSNRVTLSRVVPAAYPEARARRRIESWNAQSKSRSLPGHLPEPGLLAAWKSPATLGPLVALAVALAWSWWRGRRGPAAECVRCGRPFCERCKRFGDSAALLHAVRRQRDAKGAARNRGPGRDVARDPTAGPPA